jgi:hypothetical protein
LNVVAGKLVGASDVDVGGTLYEVSFVDGTCAALYSGCDESTDFGITNLADATAAAQALLDQVLVDGAEGLFDSQYGLTAGCADNAVGQCGIVTPYDVGVGGYYYVQVSNGAAEVDDVVSDGLSPGDIDLTGFDFGTLAVWTPQPVPEPGTAPLLVAGLALLSLRRRKAGGFTSATRPGARADGCAPCPSPCAAWE